MNLNEFAAQEARKYGLDPDLVSRVISAESGGNPNAVSSVGARGPMQLMPATAKALGVNINDPYDNIRGGVKYLAQQMKAFGSPDLALAAYNAGPGNVAKYGGIPPFPETQNYVKRIMPAKQTPVNAAGYDESIFGGGPSPTTAPQPRQQAAAQDLGYDPDIFTPAPTPVSTSASKPTAPQQTPAVDNPYGPKSVAKNLLSGAVRGAGSIGATLIRPFESGQENEERRVKMDAALADLVGANPEGLPYKIGKFGAEMAGTAGIGGALGKAAGALSSIPKIGQYMPGIAESLSSFGLNGPNLAARVAGGAVTGAAAAGLVDPSSAATGAALGGGLPLAGAAGRAIVGKLLPTALGASTGVGAEAIKQAAKAGYAGGEAAKTFTTNLRGSANLGDVLDVARQNLSNMNQANQAAYRSGMVDIKNDAAVLGFGDLDSALKSAFEKVSYQGKVTNPAAAGAVGKATKIVNDWRALPPEQFHTPEGMDALKKAIGGVLDSIPLEQKQARSAVGDIYSAARNTITAQSPTYAKVTRDYAEGADLIRNIEKSLVGGRNTADETALRKLQSLMRNNVQTGYGLRSELGQQLSAAGNDIYPALAGQALSNATPRGIQGAITLPTSAGAFMLGGAPATAAALAASSPRLVGEAAYAAGLLGRGVRPVALPTQQAIYRAAPLLGAD